MKRCWCEELNSEDGSNKSSPISLMKEIFHNFDIYRDHVYWTHALKCIPWKTDKQIERDWIFCAPYCSERLKEELKASSEEELVIITFGAYALTLILNIVKERESLCEIVKLKDWIDINRVPYIKEFAYGSPSDAESKRSLRIYPFYHPAAYGLPDGYDTIKKKMINEINAEISSSHKTL
jgi:uracil-DNA glycosylase